MVLKKIIMLCLLFLVSFINLSYAQQVKEYAFKGKVVDTQGEPVEDANVCLYEIKYISGDLFYETNIAEQTTTGADGSFNFVNKKSGRFYHYRYIVAEKKGFSIGWSEWAVNENKEDEIKLIKPVDTGGIVVDENNKPVSNAQVSIKNMVNEVDGKDNRFLNEMPSRLLTVFTDEGGKFKFTTLPSKTKVDFLVRKKGYGTISNERINQRLKFSSGQNDITLVLPLESKIDGIVCEKNTNKPVGVVKIMVMNDYNRSFFGHKPDISNDDGTFSIGALTAGEHVLRLILETDELAEWVAEPLKIKLETGQVINDAKVELSKGGLLEVSVIDATTGKPLKGAGASVYDEKRRQQSFGSRSDDSGIAKIRLLQGTYEISYVSAEDYTSYTQREEIAIEEGRSKRIEVKLNPQPKLAGIVTDENNNPVENARISVLPSVAEETTSDSEGRFEIKWDLGMFYPDEFDSCCLLVRHEKRKLTEVIEIGKKQQTAKIKLQPGITVSGKVVNSEGKGIAKAEVYPMLSMTMMSAGFSSTVKSDENGLFEIDNIPRGRKFQINANADGYGEKTLSFDTNNPVDNNVSIETITLPSANLSISGQIVDSEGNPVANASIQSSGSSQPRVNTKADENGNFILNGLCEGSVYIRVNAEKNNKHLTATARTEAGIEDIKIIVHEGKSATQNITKETYEQILEGSEKVIAGVIVDENDSPVANVQVGVNCIKREREDAPGKYRWTFSSYNDLTSTSDKQGRFVIALEEDVQYDLLFSPVNYAAMLVYDIPAGKQDLKVVLSKGGTISGKLLRMEGSKKIPISNAEVKLELSDNASYTHIGFDQNKTITTDSQGGFHFEHIRTKIRPHQSMSQSEWEYVPRVWQLVYGDTIKTFAFYDSNIIDDFEFVIEPDLISTRQLAGNPLPDFKGIKIDYDREKSKDKALLVCFFDIEQRPSRSCILELNKKAEEIKEKNIEVLLIHAAKVEKEYLDNWLKENQILFPIGTIETEVEQTKFNWGIKALPWLILTDKEHVVTDEGFSISEIGEKLK